MPAVQFGAAKIAPLRRRGWRWLGAFVLVVLCSLVAARADESHSPQVDAAAADALDSLRREVLAAQVTSSLTVKDVLDRVGGEEDLLKTLRGAEQVGGTRWLDDQTVQVRLVIDGTKIGRTLSRIVHQNPRKSPIPANALDRALGGWNDRTFAATGTSAGAADVLRLRPRPDDAAWRQVPDTDRRQALTAARDNAVGHVIESLRPIEFAAGRKLEEAISVPEVNQALRRWLASRPVKSVEFGNDLSIQLTLDAPPEELWPVLKSALDVEKKAPVTMLQAGWDRLRDQVIARMAPAGGSAVVHAARLSPPAEAIALPIEPPRWSNQQADAEATSPPRGSKLQTARRAEALAIEKLRQQINELPLTPTMTLGQAANRDHRLDEQIARALGRARPFKVDYGAKGAVTVHVSLNLSDLWAQLTGQP